MNNASPLRTLFDLYGSFERLLDHLQPIALIGARVYISWVFFAAGLLKVNDWETTLFLFELEYAVPFLSSVAAAYLGTFGELFFPVLLFFGIFGRISALGLSVVNIIAVISLEEMAPAALTLHILWGALLAAVVLWGAGKLSLDNLLKNSD